MNDRELLELAAKAAGYKKYYFEHMGRKNFVTIEERFYNDDWGKSGTSITTMDWNPLIDDGDALRLAVKLRIHIEWAFVGQGKPEQVNASPKGLGHCADMQLLGDDENAATRRAIVRAAAEIGRTL